MSRKNRAKKIIAKVWNEEHQCFVTVYEPEEAPKSTWMKDFAYYAMEKRIPEDAGMFAGYRFTRKNHA